MKRQYLIKSVFTAMTTLLLMSLFSSCKKNEVNESETTYLKVVNASPGSEAQSFLLAGKALISDGLNFTDASNYIQTFTGTRLVAEFRNGSAGATYATGELWLYENEHFTVFLAGGGSSTRVKLFNDDMSAPDNGKARVRFIHLSNDAPSDVRIEYPDGDDLVTNLSRDTQSGYKNVDPGTLSFKVTGTALGKLVGDYEVSGLQAGKIYTVYLAGTSDAGTTAHLVLHN